MLVPSIFGEDLFDTFFDDFKRPARSNTNINVMRTDIKETDAGFELDIDLPGYKKEDVQAELKDGYLTISAKTNTTREEKDENGNVKGVQGGQWILTKTNGMKKIYFV